MRAPPLEEKHTSGRRCSMQCSAARTKRSPTTEPIEPPRNRNSNAQATTSRPSSVPAMTTSASRSPVCFCAPARRSRYFLLSRNLSGSSGSTSIASSCCDSGSRKRVSRSRAPMRMWCLHFGQTCRLRSSSARYSTASQAGHLIHRPFRDRARAAFGLDARRHDLLEPGHGGSPEGLGAESTGSARPATAGRTRPGTRPRRNTALAAAPSARPACGRARRAPRRARPPVGRRRPTSSSEPAMLRTMWCRKALARTLISTRVAAALDRRLDQPAHRRRGLALRGAERAEVVLAEQALRGARA